MSICRELPEFKVNLKENKDDVYKLLEIIKPEWNKDEIKIKTLSGGFSCAMLRCSADSDKSVTVRVRDYLDGLRDPILERQVVKEVSSRGYFSPVLAIFQNGFCYEYIPGRPVVSLDTKEISVDEEQLRLIAEQLANIHSVKIPEFDHSKTDYFDFIAGLLSNSKPCCEGCPSMDELEQELRFVEEVAASVESPLVLIHGDTHPGNFVWDEDKHEITFVDWELAQIAPRAIDIAYFLDSFENAGHYLGIPSKSPSDFKGQFCIPYLQRWNEIHNKPAPSESEIEQLLKEVKYYMLAILLNGAIYTVKFDDLTAKFGEIESLWQFNIGRYLSAKEELLGIKGLGKSDNAV